MTRLATERSSRRKRRRIAAARMAAFVVAFAFLWPAELPAQQTKPSEYRVKAVYIYNFGKFVSWPPEPDSAQPVSFPICVLGQDPFGATLDDIVKGETLNGQLLVIRRIDKPENAAGCRILFIGSSEQDRIPRILEALSGKPILTVGETPGFCDRGGMIQFVLENDKVRFQANVSPAEKAGLMLGSQLLRVASSVRGNPGTEK